LNSFHTEKMEIKFSIYNVENKLVIFM